MINYYYKIIKYFYNLFNTLENLPLTYINDAPPDKCSISA